MRRAALFEIIEHHIRRAYQLLIAAHVIGTPNEVAGVSLCHITHSCPLISTEGEHCCGRLTERWASVVGGEWREASLYWASW
jgi:hypothetical protein